MTIDFDSKRILGANPFLSTLLGVSRGDLIGRTVAECWPSRNALAFAAVLDGMQPNGSFRYEDMKFTAKEGEPRDMEIVGNAFQAGDRRLIGCGVRDITARSKIEDQLRLLQTCVAHINDVFMVTEAHPIDEPGPKIVFANEAVERITGYKPAELIGRSPRMLQGAKTDRKTLNEIRHALENHQPIRRHLVNYGKDGREYWLSINLVPIFSAEGKCTHFAAIERDITEAKIQESRLRRLIDSNVQGVLFWNSKRTITEANHNFLQLSGYSREDVLSGSVTWSSLMPERFADRWQRTFEKLAQNGAVSPCEIEIIRKDGSTLPVLFGASCVEENLQDGVGFILDLTERKRMEQEILSAKRTESLGTLAAGMAHHLNNILSPIVMSIGMLKLTTTNPGDKGMLDVIDTSARRAAAIIRQVLSFALGTKGADDEVRPQDLIDRIQGVVTTTFPKRIRLATYVADDAWTIRGDPSQLQEALLNLCLNARDAMPEGGALTLQVENVVVDGQSTGLRREASAGPYVAISVTDTGTGIPPGIIDRIFDPFFTTKEVGQGNGLGLSMVMAVVKGHGGFVDVASELGKGTTFTVFLAAKETRPDERTRD
jgi:PAS domain S-box-containing protein